MIHYYPPADKIRRYDPASAYGRRVYVNNADRHMRDDDPIRESCGLCGIVLSYLKSHNVWFCAKCGYNRPKDLDQKQEEDQQQQQPTNHKILTSDTAENPNPDDSIFIVSKGDSRTEQLRRKINDYDGHNWLRKKDDERLTRQSGATLVKDDISIPDSRAGSPTLSFDELERQRQQRERDLLRRRTRG